MRPLIPSFVKNRVISLLENEMVTDCIVYKAGTATTDGMGGFTDAADVLVETTTCFIGQIGQSTAEREIAAQNTEAVLYAFRMPHDSLVTKNHWIVADSLTYMVLGFANSDIDVYKKVIVRLDR